MITFVDSVFSGNSSGHSPLNMTLTCARGRYSKEVFLYSVPLRIACKVDAEGFFWLCWVFVSVRGLSPVVASGGHSLSQCAGLSPSRPLPLWSTGSRRAGSVVVAHGLSCSEACGIFPDQGSNPRPLHWQADS